jgi:hypothetical protein
VLGYSAQVFPAPRSMAFSSQLAAQRLAHLPHHGVPPALLRSLPTVGDLELLPLDLYVTASRALASARLAPMASDMLVHLQAAAARSELRPLCSLGPSGGLAAGFAFQPFGWDGGALASHVDAARNILASARDVVAPRREGRALSAAAVARVLEPCLSAASLGGLLAERIRLWLPPRLVPFGLVSLVTGYVSVLAKAPAPERWAALKFLCNSWTLAHRFGGRTPPCPACGLVSGERLQHLVACRAFWAPVLAAHRDLASATFAALALGSHSPRSMLRAFRALSTPSSASWHLRVQAAL